MRGGIITIPFRTSVAGAVASETWKCETELAPGDLPGASSTASCDLSLVGWFTGSATFTLRVRQDGTPGSAADGTLLATLVGTPTGYGRTSVTFVRPSTNFILKLSMEADAGCTCQCAAILLARTA